MAGVIDYAFKSIAYSWISNSQQQYSNKQRRDKSHNVMCAHTSISVTMKYKKSDYVLRGVELHCMS